MSWASRIHRPPGSPPLSQVQAAVQNLADQVGIKDGKVRVVFSTVADVALIGTVVVSGALAAVHLYRALFPKHKEEHPHPEPAAGGGSPPHRRGPRAATAFADGHDGQERHGHRSR